MSKQHLFMYFYAIQDYRQKGKVDGYCIVNNLYDSFWSSSVGFLKRFGDFSHGIAHYRL